MAYIRQVAEEDAEGRLEKCYAAARTRADGIANIIRVMSVDGRSAAGSMQFYVNIMKAPNALQPAEREMLAVVVSNVNDCYY